MASEPLPPAPEHSPSDKLPKFGFSGFCLLVGLVTFAVQQGCAVTGTSPSWLWGAVWFFIATALVVLAIWFWDQAASHHWIRKSVLTVIVAVIVGGFSYTQVAKQYRAEYPVKQTSPASPINQKPISQSIPHPSNSKVQRTRSASPLIYVDGIQVDKKTGEVHLAFKNTSKDPAYKVKETRWTEGGQLGPIWDKSPLGMRLVFIKSYDGLKAGNVSVADVGTLAPGEPFVDVWMDESAKYRTEHQPVVQNTGSLTYTDYLGKVKHAVTFCYEVQFVKVINTPELSEWMAMKCRQGGGNDSR